MTADRFRIVHRRQILSPGVPPGVQTLIYLNLAMFSLMVLQGAAHGDGFGVLMNPSIDLLIRSGSQAWPRVLANGEWWRGLTYAFTHGGLIHLGFNMLVFYQVAPTTERELGWQGLVFLYTFTALTATLAGLLFHPMVVVVGASGAIFGLFGFAISFYHRLGTTLAHLRRNYMLQWALYALLFGFIVHADNAGHLGGLVGGALLGVLLPTQMERLHRFLPVLRAMGWVSALLIGAAHLAFLAWWVQITFVH